MSPAMNSISCCTSASRRGAPRELSSRTRTALPSLSNAFTSAEPMKPLPPVIRIRAIAAPDVRQYKNAGTCNSLLSSTMSNTEMPRPIAWFGPHLTGLELERVRDVLDRQYINDGPLAREFERRVAALVGARHAVAVTSGTAAITLALMAAGIGPGDEVLVPDLTFAATANAVRLAGADVKLVDVEPIRFGIDPDGVEAAISQRTRALVTVDVNGRGADYGRIEPLCRDKGLVLICDAAEGLGSRYGGRASGALRLASCFSFLANKKNTPGQRGIITTHNHAPHHRLRALQDP